MKLLLVVIFLTLCILTLWGCNDCKLCQDLGLTPDPNYCTWNRTMGWSRGWVTLEDLHGLPPYQEQFVEPNIRWKSPAEREYQ